MLPNRADYKNKKDYKWARKQAQRGRDCYRHRHCVGSGSRLVPDVLCSRPRLQGTRL